VWRLAGFGRSLAWLIIGPTAVMALVLWGQAAWHASLHGALEALAATGVGFAMGLALWWVALRPKVVIDRDEIVVVNPWGTQRVAMADVVTVTRGLLGARLLLRSGWVVTAFALADAYEGGFARGRRVAEVADAVATRQRAPGRR
jgi:hypothetical protein